MRNELQDISQNIKVKAEKVSNGEVSLGGVKKMIKAVIADVRSRSKLLSSGRAKKMALRLGGKLRPSDEQKLLETLIWDISALNARGKRERQGVRHEENTLVSVPLWGAHEKSIRDLEAPKVISSKRGRKNQLFGSFFKAWNVEKVSRQEFKELDLTLEQSERQFTANLKQGDTKITNRIVLNGYKRLEHIPSNGLRNTKVRHA